MLIITNTQKTAMLATDKNFLFSRIMEGVYENYPQIIQNIPDDILTLMVEHGVRMADSFGFNNPGDIAGFVYIMFEIAPEFYRQPEIRAVLTNPSIPLDEKLPALFEKVSPQAWQQVVDVLHKQTWFPELRDMEK